MGLAIRDTRREDLAAITAIYRHYVLHGTSTFEIDPPSEFEMEHRWLAVQKVELPFLCAEADGQVVGYAYANNYRLRPAYRYTVESSIYLHTEFCGRGIGERLLREIIGQCASKGRKQMVAIIGDSANLASRKLHLKCGFRLVGTLEKVGYKFDRWLDTVLMQKDLMQKDLSA